MAAAGLGGRALAALRAGVGDRLHRLAVRVVPRLVDVAVLSGADANARIRQPGGGEGDRRPAPGHGMGAAAGDRPARGGSTGPPLRITRPCHAADVACAATAIAV